MLATNIVYYDQKIRENLGNWITLWYPNAPKTYGLCIIRNTLEQYAAWNRFITNFHKIQKQEGHIQVFEYIIRTKDVTMLLEWAFIWSATAEGSDYWKSLNIKVKEKLKQKEDEGIKLNDICQNADVLFDNIGSRDFKFKPNLERHSKNQQFTKNEWADDTNNEDNIIHLLSDATQHFISNMHCIRGTFPYYDNRIKLVVPLSKTTIIKINKI